MALAQCPPGSYYNIVCSLCIEIVIVIVLQHVLFLYILFALHFAPWTSTLENIWLRENTPKFQFLPQLWSQMFGRCLQALASVQIWVLHSTCRCTISVDFTRTPVPVSVKVRLGVAVRLGGLNLNISFCTSSSIGETWWNMVKSAFSCFFSQLLSIWRGGNTCMVQIALGVLFRDVYSCLCRVQKWKIFDMGLYTANTLRVGQNKSL